MRLALWAAAVVWLLYALHRTALWMERRGWIFYRETKASSSAMSNAFMQVQAMFEPAAEYVVKRRRTDEVEEAGAGDPPTLFGGSTGSRSTTPVETFALEAFVEGFKKYF